MIVESPLSRATVLRTGETRLRQTPRSGAARFRELLQAGGQALVAGAEAALRTLPGGQVLCAAVREGGAAAGAPRPGSAAGPGEGGTEAAGGDDHSDLRSLTEESQAFNLMYLQLQEEMSRESRRYSALSNVLKSRHETARAIISNM